MGFENCMHVNLISKVIKILFVCYGCNAKFIWNQSQHCLDLIRQRQQNKQNQMNPEQQQLPDFVSVKRSIEYKNYQYNQNQIQQRHQLEKKMKQYEIETTSFLNKKALEELQIQKIKQARKKSLVQQELQRQYDRQMQLQKRVKTQQKQVDKVYSGMYKEMLDNYEKSRAFQMAKIYKNAQGKTNSKNSYFPSRNILTEPDQDTLDKFRNQSLNSFQAKSSEQSRRQFVQNGKQKEFQQVKRASFDVIPQYSIQKSLPRIDNVLQSKEDISLPLKNPKGNQSQLSRRQVPQPSQNVRYQPHLTSPSPEQLQNSRSKKYSSINLDYADYLKRQIDRKQKEKQEQKRRDLEKDKNYIERQTKAYHDVLESMRYNNQKKKYDYATGLDRQIIMKRERLMASRFG